MTSRPTQPVPVAELEAQRIRAVPALHAFVSAVEETFASGGEDAFWHCEPLFHTLCQTGFERELIHYELGRMAEDKAYHPSGITNSKLRLAVGSQYRLILVARSPADGIDSRYSTMEEHRIMAVLGPGDLALSLFKHPPEYRNDVFDRAAALLPNGEIVLRRGGIGRFVAGRDVIGARRNTAPTVTAVFASGIRQTLRWEYDPATLLPLRAVAIETASSRLQYAAQLFAQVGGESTLPALRKMLEHHEHFVRWSALQSIVAIEPIEGAARVRDALLDPHPHIRNAATRALTKMAELGAPMAATE